MSALVFGLLLPFCTCWVVDGLLWWCLSVWLLTACCIRFIRASVRWLRAITTYLKIFWFVMSICWENARGLLFFASSFICTTTFSRWRSFGSLCFLTSTLLLFNSVSMLCYFYDISWTMAQCKLQQSNSDISIQSSTYSSSAMWLVIILVFTCYWCDPLCLYMLLMLRPTFFLTSSPTIG